VKSAKRRFRADLLDAADRIVEAASSDPELALNAVEETFDLILDPTA
jgi:hypothetical protein